MWNLIVLDALHLFLNFEFENVLGYEFYSEFKLVGKLVGISIFSEQSDRSRRSPKCQILIVLHALGLFLNFEFENVLGYGFYSEFKLVGKLVGISIFSEQSDRSCCLPKF